MAKITDQPFIVDMLPPRKVEEEAVPPELKRYRELLAAQKAREPKTPRSQIKEKQVQTARRQACQN
eukprot:4421532-Prymnesium_polylepis.2